MIQIVLATYNGAMYLEAQLESLLLQTMTDWQLLVHDDGSSDTTLKTLEAYRQCHPERIKLLIDDITFGNARDNFTHLLAAATSDYVMFCDQDDVWLAEKIEKTYAAMQLLEASNFGIPIVVHTDLVVVDSQLVTIAASMFSYQGLNKHPRGLLEVLAKNSVTGCTMMLNRAAIQVSLPIDPVAIMHDWWITAMVVKHQGKIGFVDEPLILYRQHENNAVGAKKHSIFSIITRIFTYASHSDIRKQVLQQAKHIEPNLNTVYFFSYKLYFALKSMF